jgi:hypothetical protein
LQIAWTARFFFSGRLAIFIRKVGATQIMLGSSNGKGFTECSMPLHKSWSIRTEIVGNGLKSLQLSAIWAAQTAFDDLNSQRHG